MVVEVGDRMEESMHRQARGVWRALEAAALPGVRDLVPAYTTVTVFYDPLWWAAQGVKAAEVFGLLEQRVRAVVGDGAEGSEPATSPREVAIPVCYDGGCGPDLGEVARRTGLAEAEVIRLHLGAEYVVELIGFTPGFPYLSGLPAALEVPRRAQPRSAVPPGSVAIAGKQAGIYPLSTPGGWHLIGRTPRRLFQPEADPPAFLAPGDRVRFVRIGAPEYERLEAERT